MSEEHSLGKKDPVTRRAFVAGAATAIVSAVVGGIIGSQAFPRTVTEKITKEVTKTLTSTTTVPTTITSTTTKKLTETLTTTVEKVTTERIPEVKTVEIPRPAVVKGELGWQLNVDYDKCSGCRLCELACSIKHFGVINPELSRIRVLRFYPGIDIPTYCRQCPEHPCIDVCPVGALSVSDKTGAIVVDKEKCIKCGMCAKVCPAEAIRYHPEEGWPLICDLCGLEPECAKICPQGALDWGNVAVVTTYQARSPIETFKELLAKYGISIEDVREKGQIE